MSAKGLPFALRGGLVVDVAAMRLADNNNPSAAIDIKAHIPVGDRTFLDAVLPIGFGVLGNPMVGAHHVFRPSDRLWISLGGAVGVPLVNSRGFEIFQVARSFWDMQEFASYTMPFAARLGIEGHVSIVELRAQLEPVWGISVKDREDHLFALQHAVEIQIGHVIGGGLRYQGTVVATEALDPISRGEDHYQGAFELFFRIQRDPLFARLGFTLPLDMPLGDYDGDGRSWGVRGQLGFNLD